MKPVGVLSSKAEDQDDEALVEIEESESEIEASLSGCSESESDIDLEVDATKTGELGSLARRARELEEVLKSADDTEDKEETEEGDLLGWGHSRDRFYGTDERRKVDDRKEDVEESIKLQKAHLSLLKDSDFELPVLKRSKEKTHSLEEAKAVQSSDKDSEDLVTVYNNLKSALEELKTKICPLLEEAQKDDICTNQEGTSVENHPVIFRLVEIRTFLEKMKPMETRLQPQVDKLLKAISLSKEDESSLSARKSVGQQVGLLGSDRIEDEEMGPRPEDLIPKLTGDGQEVYRPPKLNPVMMEEDRPSKQAPLKKRQRKDLVRNDSMVGELVREMTGAPEEAPAGSNSLTATKSLLSADKSQDKFNFEEENYSRLSSTKQSKKSKDKQKEETYGGMAFDDFADDIEATLTAITSSSTAKGLPVHKQNSLVPSGDADLPLGATKLQKLENAQPRKTNEKTLTEEWAQEDSPRKKKSRKIVEVKMSRPPRAAPMTKGKRAISEEIYKNRGLTPHRTRENKNPRKRHRRQFENKEKRRRGQMQKSHSEAPDHYGGERSGISARVRKSILYQKT